MEPRRDPDGLNLPWQLEQRLADVEARVAELERRMAVAERQLRRLRRRWWLR